MKKRPRREGSRLADFLGIEARLRAKEMRVDESREAEVRRGRWRSFRRGLPPSGAEEGVTYHEVDVGIRVEGETREDSSGRSPEE